MVQTMVRGADLVAKPWPNGHGITRDVAGKQSLDRRSDWLISIADLARDADFSYFADCDRYFTLVDGEGVELAVGAGVPVRCTPLVPFFFAGDVPTRCRVRNPARAFNVFVARDYGRIEVSARIVAGGHRIRLAHNLVAVYCAFGKLIAGDHVLGQGDTLVDPGILEARAGEAAGLVFVQTTQGVDQGVL